MCVHSRSKTGLYYFPLGVFRKYKATLEMIGGSQGNFFAQQVGMQYFLSRELGAGLKKNSWQDNNKK